MAKCFFKSYKRVKDRLNDYKDTYDFKEQTEYRSYTDKCYVCLQSLEKYLYSYRWCRKENEKVLLQTVDSCKSAEVIAKENNMVYNSYRAMSSRVSRRLYDQLGMDFDKVILGNDEKAQNRLIHICIARCEDFNLSSLYPDFVFSKMKEIADAQEVEIEGDFKVTKEVGVVLKFLADYSMDGILQSISLMDEKWLAYCFKILADNQYFNERVEILAYINRFKKKLTKDQKYREAALSRDRGVLIPKKEYAEFLKYKEARKNEII